MKFKIDFRPVLADPLHGVRIVLYVLFLVVVFFPLQKVLLHKVGWGHSFEGATSLFYLAQPAILAGGIEVQEGIHSFGGNSNRGVWSGQITSVLVSIISAYILGPALLAWGLRARFRRRRNLSGNAGVTWIAIALTLGSLSLVSIVPAPVYAIIGSETFKMMANDCVRSERQDYMSDELFMMARKAQVMYFLPCEMGGGNQSWMARDGSGNPVIDISGVLPPAQAGEDDRGQSPSGSGGRYSLHVERADSLTIRGVLAEAGVEGSGVEGSSDQSARVEMCVGVTPDRVNIISAPLP